MQPTPITISYTDAADDTTPISKAYEKRLLGPYRSEYQYDETFASGNYDRFVLTAKEPVETPSFFGVHRAESVWRQDVSVELPSGEFRKYPVSLRLTGSVPKGTTPVVIQNKIRELVAYVQSGAFYDQLMKSSV